MQFNADKKDEVVFSCKRNKPIDARLTLGGELIASKSEHKHLGAILDSKLNFKSHDMNLLRELEETAITNFLVLNKSLYLGHCRSQDQNAKNCFEPGTV